MRKLLPQLAILITVLITALITPLVYSDQLRDQWGMSAVPRYCSESDRHQRAPV